MSRWGSKERVCMAEGGIIVLAAVAVAFLAFSAMLFWMTRTDGE
jgi:hypothetical protein